MVEKGKGKGGAFSSNYLEERSEVNWNPSKQQLIFVQFIKYLVSGIWLIFEAIISQKL